MHTVMRCCGNIMENEKYADVGEPVDPLDLGSSIEICAGSNPVIRT